MPEAFLTINLVFDILQDYINEVAHSYVKNDSYVLIVSISYICNRKGASKGYMCVRSLAHSLLVQRTYSYQVVSTGWQT